MSNNAFDYWRTRQGGTGLRRVNAAGLDQDPVAREWQIRTGQYYMKT